MSSGVDDKTQTFEQTAARPFEALPDDMMVQAFGVKYAHLRTADGGDLYITRYGWPWAPCLVPEQWYTDRHYRKEGMRLSGSTGHAYRVMTRPVDGRSIDLVIKFSRVGQEVPLVITTNLGEDFSAGEVANARFNSPMEEFGLLEELRRGAFGPSRLRVLTQKPLAIYAPSQELALWKLGRTPGRFRAHQMLLAADQENAGQLIDLDIKREYVMLFQWIKGHDAEHAYLSGQFTEKQLVDLTHRAVELMRAKGFRVLDTKPKHFIVRPRHDQTLLRRNGQVAFALVDYELLGRTLDWQRQYNASRRAKYLTILSQQDSEPAKPCPAHLKRMNILGVDYVYGPAPNGGRIWAVGSNPELFDFFLPDRWRRTPRMKLSIANEVYRTRTRDNIHVVYRLSRVGVRPWGDPFYEQDKRIREHGYNSPFEEIAIAQLLQRYGISTIHPRAIYRTGHRTIKAGYLRDDRRRNMLADLKCPDGEPILSPDHDYYTIWGYWRGLDPLRQYRRNRHWGFIDMEKAYEDRHLSNEEFNQTLAHTRQRLNAAGFDGSCVEPFEMLLIFGKDGVLERDRHGRLEITISIDALTAHEFGLLSESSYREICRRIRARLLLTGCKTLNLSGSHLLLAMNPDGQFLCDDKGHLMVTLGNLELIRVLRCPLNKPVSWSG